MYLSGDMSNLPHNNIPLIWFIHRREHIETHCNALASLRDKLDRVAGGGNVLPILEAVDSLQELYSQVDSMQANLDDYLSPIENEYNPYNRNELGRIKELALSTANQLEAIAQRISWGLPLDKHTLQVKRNLNPLISLTGKILFWLEQAI
jgi:hypothetical protein